MNFICSRCTLIIFFIVVFFVCAGCKKDIRYDDCVGVSVPVARDGSFVQWMIAHGEELKRKGCWKRHEEYGDEALNLAKKEKNDNAVLVLLIQLASTSFYLGDSEKCREQAQEAQRLAEKLGRRKEEVQSLYLLSAGDRAQKKSSALVNAEKALALCNRYLPDEPELKAKVLYNLAAAEIEIEPRNLEAAEQHLFSAIEILKNSKTNYDNVRMGLRLAHVQYLQGFYDKAENTVIDLGKYTTSPREKMLYYFQLAKIQNAQKKWTLATQNSQEAYNIAKVLEAQIDIMRISNLIEAIKGKKLMPE